MTQDDFPQFSAMVTDLAGCYPKQVTLTAGMLAMMFRALVPYPLDAVRSAMDAHLRHPADCKFFPMPGQLIGHITAAANDDGRLGPEEAWALALTSRDEADTVVWTDEIAQAWRTASVVYGQGDEVGARMAFKEAYARLVAEARAARRPLRWIVAEGFDQARRITAVQLAAERGRHLVLSDEQAAALRLPAPTGAVAFLPAPDGPDVHAEAREAATLALAAIAARSTTVPERVSEAFADTDRFQGLKDRTAQRVGTYSGGASA